MLQYKDYILYLELPVRYFVLNNQDYKVVKEFKGEELLGLSYQPLYQQH